MLKRRAPLPQHAELVVARDHADDALRAAHENVAFKLRRSLGIALVGPVIHRTYERADAIVLAERTGLFWKLPDLYLALLTNPAAVLVIAFCEYDPNLLPEEHPAP